MIAFVGGDEFGFGGDELDRFDALIAIAPDPLIPRHSAA
jgi:hypothetical protein